ncbi:hypothetical protein OESDEN_05268 [Oesophagostomum dentatum]|uniref:Uncharacterized protein n=1 Tax=Oesophagostomum dentatum TaxID=61180 RepID=A0A0B1TBZ6_OESDE|nr:hypothetical protein OESDEN_05268 [Oesophagostomum dentatum]
MDQAMDDYKTVIVQGILEIHERVREHNNRMRQIMKNAGTSLTSETQPGHLRFQCLDQCLMESRLADIPDVAFPGAFAKEPVGTVWKAWIATRIFSRHDIDLPTKIRLFRRGAVCLDEVALKPVLKLAYNRCTAWTEFICSRESIASHKEVEGFLGASDNRLPEEGHSAKKPHDSGTYH